jgi:hypothetical protein
MGSDFTNFVELPSTGASGGILEVYWTGYSGWAQRFGSFPATGWTYLVVNLCLWATSQ